MSTQSKSAKIRSYFAAYKSKDRQVVEDGLADDFTFTSPYDDAIDKATYFERCWPNSEKIRSHMIEKIFEQGDEAFVLYKCVTNDGKEFRNTEFFTFDGDRVKRVDVYFGAAYRDGNLHQGPMR
jgi:ketosteroid isomerase-like protein